MNELVLITSFAATALLLVVAPGIDTALVLRTSITEGRRSGMATALGIGLGSLCWGVAVTFGLATLLRASPQAFAALTWIGAVYLAWLGIRLLRQRPAPAPSPPSAPGPAHRSGAAAFGQGLIGNLLNPKVGLFYVTLLPQFVPEGDQVAPWSLLLTGVHVLLAILWFVVLAASTSTVAPVLRRPRAMRCIDRLTAGVFLAFAANLAVSPPA